MDLKPLMFGSLFAGIGGLDLGLERAGLVCEWQVEINDYATKVLEKHWPKIRKHRDIKTFPVSGNWEVDLIVGGFPCQDISIAGNKAGLSGKKSGLFFELIRVVRLLRPKYVLLENVSALLHRGMGSVLSELAKGGYNAEWHCIPASCLGAPHRRDRIFILAHSIGNPSNDNQSYFSKPRRACHNVGHNEQRELLSNSQGRIFKSQEKQPKDIFRFKNSEKEMVEQDQQTRSAGYREAHSKTQKNHWSSEPGIPRVVDGVPFQMDRLTSLGNAVVPQIAEMIGHIIVENHNSLKENE